MNRFFILIILIFISCNSDETNNVIYSELDNPVYLDDNGVTVKAKEWAEVGMTGQLNGVTYIVANREMLEDMIDEFGNQRAFRTNVDREYERNMERYSFLKWGQSAFNNFRVVPPGTGI